MSPRAKGIIRGVVIVVLICAAAYGIWWFKNMVAP